MYTIPYVDFTTFIQNSLQEASKIANSHFGKVSGITKPGNNNQVLTEADLAVGDYLIKEIESTYPAHNIIDEEKGVKDKGGNHTWVIDPIDGTSNFACSVPLYGIMLGLLKKDMAVAGGVVLPYFNESYLAEKGSGTYCNGQKIHVTQEKRLLSTLVAFQIDGHQEDPPRTRKESRAIGELALNIRNLRDSGSVFDSMMVARGKYGGYVSCSGRIWDAVAQHIIIEEAGGVYTSFSGDPMDYSNALHRTEETFTWCAASPALHEQIQKIIHSKL